MVTQDNIGWASYGAYEGPHFTGKLTFSLPENPSKSDLLLEVITAAEGGHYDAINMYDSGIVSVGLIQWCEAVVGGVSMLLGNVAEACGAEAITTPLKPAFDSTGSTFKKNSTGKWRFFLTADGSEVDTNIKKRQLFLGCPGTKGSWTENAKKRAKLWAACFASVWDDPRARKVQVDCTAARLRGFVTNEASSVVYDGSPDEGWSGCGRSAYVSFAVNVPLAASNQLKAFLAKTTLERWSEGWVIGMIRQLVTGTTIKEWKQRYDSIRPVLERQFGVTMPKTSEELQAWQPEGTEKPESSPAPAQPKPPAADRPVAMLPLVPGESPGQRLARIAYSHVGCSLKNRRDELGKLVARGVDSPEKVVTITTNCGTSALGVMAQAGVRDAILNKPYQSGMAIAWLRAIGQRTGALQKYSRSGPQPKIGSLMRYNTAGKNDDHVEWLLSDVGNNGVAHHCGGGKANNAITEATGNITVSFNRPLVEWWDPDKLGIEVLPSLDEQGQKMGGEHVEPARPQMLAPLDNAHVQWYIALLNAFIALARIVIDIFVKRGK